MKKRFWSLLLVLVMVFTMIPTTAYEASTAGIGFYYAQGTQAGLVENTNMGFVTQIMDAPGPARQGFFYYVDVNGNKTNLNVNNLVSNNTNIIKLSQNDINPNITNFEIVGFGQTTIDYTVAGQTYSINVDVQLPPVACYSSTSASVSTYLNSFTVTDTSNTFYVVPKNSMPINSITLQGQLASIASYSIAQDKSYATITINGTPGSMNMGRDSILCEVLTNVFDPNGQMQQQSQRFQVPIQLINGKPSLKYAWPEWDSNNQPVKPSISNRWDSEFYSPAPGQGWECYFSVITADSETCVANNLISSEASIVKVTAIDANTGFYLIEFLKEGSATLSCTDANGKIYTMDVNVSLPNVGAYTSKTPSGSSLIMDGVVINNIGDEFYLIARNGYKINSVNLINQFNDFATVSLDSSKTIATIKITDKPIGGEKWIEYEFVDPYTGYSEGDTYCVGIINNTPHISYVYQDDTRYNELEIIDGALPGDQPFGYINFYPGGTAAPGVVGIEDLKSTDESVVKISSANDPQYPDMIKIDILDWGTAQIVYTDINGKTYELDIVVDFDNLCEGLFIDDEFKVENWISPKYAITNETKVIYLMTRYGWEIANPVLDGDACNYASLKVINDYCVEITISDKINDYLAYGEEGTFTVKYEEVGDNEGFLTEACFEITNKTCKHTETEVIGHKVATCMENGYRGDVVCKQCKEVLAKGSDIPAKGHSYVDGKCKDCGEKAVVVEKVEIVDTTKPVEEVTPVVEQSVADTAAKEVSLIVDAILADEVTDEVKAAVSEETIEEIKKELAAGKLITTEVVAKPVEEKEVDKEVVKEIEKELGTTGKVAQFLDLSIMIKSVAADGAEKDLGTLNVLGEKVKFTIVVPEDLLKEGREFYVVRVHDGEAEILDLTKNADGTYSFETDKFSTYALAYEEVEDAVKEVVAPKTGDDSNALGYMMLFAVAFAVFALAKKENYLLK